MGSLFRRTITDPKTGQKLKTKTWYGQFTDANGRRTRVALSENKAAALQMLSELERRAERESAGIRDPYTSHQSTALAMLLTEYQQHHLDRGNTAKQGEQAVSRCRSVFAACKMTFLRDVDSAKIDSQLADAWRAKRAVLVRRRQITSSRC